MGRRRKFEEQDVIAAAGGVFSSNGYNGTSLDDLVTATGVGKQSLYNAFGDKHDFFLRVLTADTDDALAAVNEAFAEQTASPLEQIRAHLLKLAITHSDEAIRGPLFTKAAAELAGHDPQVSESVRRAFTGLAEIYRRCLVHAQESGEIAADLDVDALADFFVAVTRGIELLGNAQVGRAELTRIAMTSLDVLRLSPSRKAPE